MKKVLKKIISIIILIILLGTFEAPNIIQTVYAATEYVQSNDRGDIFKNVYSEGELENIMPFMPKDYNDRIYKDYIVGEFEKAGKTVRNESELQDIIGTGTKIETNYETYTILIYGDVDGNGRVTVGDAEKTFRHAIRGGEYILTGVYKIAANAMNTDNNITVADAEYIFRFALGRVTKIPYKTPEYPEPTPTPTPTSTPTPPRPTSIPRPQEPLTLTATLETKTEYFYYEEHTITLSGTRGNKVEKITRADVSIVDENGNTVSTQNAQITNKAAQSDGTYKLTFVAKVAGTYKVIAKVSGEQSETTITIKDNPVIDTVIFGSKENPQNPLTLTTGQTKQIPLIFENKQGVQLTPTTITTSPTISGINVSVTDGVLTIEGVNEIATTTLNIIADGKTVGTLTLNVIPVITSISTKVLGQNFLTENKYPVTIELDGKESTISQDKIEWIIKNNGTTVSTSVASVKLENGQYYFTTTEPGSYIVLGVIKEDLDAQQGKVEETESGKTAITVSENNTINKIEIVNDKTTVTINNGTADKSIDIYAGETRTLPITFKHNTKVINATIGDITLNTISNATIKKKAKVGEEDANTNALARLEITGTTAGEQELEITQGGEIIGTVTINVMNPLFKVTPVKTPVKMIVGETTKKEAGMTIEDDLAYTLFKVEKVDENGVKRGTVTAADIVKATEKLTVTITNGATTLKAAHKSILGFVADANGNNAVWTESGEITHIGIAITNEDIDVNEPTTIKISYQDLKTVADKNASEYVYENVTVTKVITSVTSSILGQKFLTGVKYPVTIALNGETSEIKTNILSWEIYKDGNTTTPVAKSVADVVFENEQYQFIATQSGDYVIKAIVKETSIQGSIPENITGKAAITVNEDNTINLIEIVNEGTKVTINNGTADKSIDVYAGETRTLPITFKHNTKVINATIGEIDFSQISNATIKKKAKVGEEDANTNALARLEITGTTAGEQELEITQGTEIIGTVTINVMNPLFKVTPVATPVKMIVGETTNKEAGMTIEDDLAYTLFKVEKVDENGVKRGTVTAADIVKATEKLTVTITNGATTLKAAHKSILGFVADANGNNAVWTESGEITHIGIAITNEDIDVNEPTTITISYQDLKTVADKNASEYVYENVAVTKVITSVTSSILGQKFLTGVKYPVTIALNGETSEVKTNILSWEIYKDGNTTTPVAKSVADVVFENEQYQFIATQSGDYVIKAIVKETSIQGNIPENITGKAAITVNEDNTINLIEIVNEGTKVTINNGTADKSIDVYAGETRTLPITLKHNTKVVNAKIGEIDFSQISNATIKKKAAEGKEDANGEDLVRIEITGTTVGEQELEITQGTETIGTVRVKVINPLFKVTPVATPVKMIVGETTKKEAGMTIEDDLAYTLFKVEKVDENGVKRGTVTAADIVKATEKLTVAITNGTTTLKAAHKSILGFVADANGNNAVWTESGEITHIGIAITNEDIDINEATTITISYQDLKTVADKNASEYVYENVTVTKAITI